MSNTMAMHISKLKLGKYFEIVSVTKIIATILNVGDVDQESSLRYRHYTCSNVDDKNAPTTTNLRQQQFCRRILVGDIVVGVKIVLEHLLRMFQLELKTFHSMVLSKLS